MAFGFQPLNVLPCPVCRRLIPEHFGSHPLLHVIQHLLVRFDIDAGILLVYRDHDGIYFCAAAPGRKVVYLFGAVRIEPRGILRRNDLGVLDIDIQARFTF